MSEQFKICKSEQTEILGFKFKKWDGEINCAIEEFIPKDALCCKIEEACLYFKSADIGTDPHPFLLFCEAARYINGGWIVGVDHIKNQYFTPVFT